MFELSFLNIKFLFNAQGTTNLYYKSCILSLSKKVLDYEKDRKKQELNCTKSPNFGKFKSFTDNNV